jgi:integrase
MKNKQRDHPALPYMRLGAFMVDLSLREGMSARALEWGILNASRFEEIAGAKRREVDLLLKRWTIPPERMKRAIEHVVPLRDEAIFLLNRLPPGGSDDLLFPASEGGQLSDSALGAMIDGIHEADLAGGGTGYLDPKEGRIATQHGFRSTFRDWASEVGYFDREIVEHAIAHKLKDKAEAAYQRGTLLAKRALMMKQWGEFCRTPAFSCCANGHVAMVADARCN